MGCLNDQAGYKEGLLIIRSVIRKEDCVPLEPDGLAKDSIPGYESCDVATLGSPAMGATFADYLATVKGGGKSSDIGGEGLETFTHVLTGKVVVKGVGREGNLTEGSYIFPLKSVRVSFENKSGREARLYAYKRRYEKTEGYNVLTVVGSASDVPWIEYEGMDSCCIKDFLPAAGNLGFNMNMYILKFKLGASHGYVEIHIQEHRVYFLSDKGMHRADNDWVPVKAGGYMFPDAYCS